MNKKIFSGVMAVITAITLCPIVSFAAATVNNGYLSPDVGNVANADYGNQEQKSIIAFFTNNSEAVFPEELTDIIILDEADSVEESYNIAIPDNHKDYIVILFGGSSKITAKTIVELPHVSHSYGDWDFDSTYHWKPCTKNGCNEISDKAEHITQDDNDCTTPVKCNVCDYETILGADGHTYSDSYDSTCETDGCNHVRTANTSVNVMFDVNGGTALANNTAATGSNGKLTSALPTPLRNGWSFDGWYTSQTGGSKIDKAITTFYDNATVYAHWTRVSVQSGSVGSGSGGGFGGVIGNSTYKLTFDTNGGTLVDSYTGIKDITIHLGDYVTTKENCEFAGWYSDKSLTQKVDTIKLSGNLTVYAKWDEISESIQDGPEVTTRFSDVSSDDWFSEAVTFVLDKGIMNGVSETEFAPHNTTTRAMLVTMLYRLNGEPETKGQNEFSDVSKDAYYEKAVIWAKENGIVNGYENGSFGTDDMVTREQLASILYRYAEHKGFDAVYEDTNILSFNDAFDISEYAYPALGWACKNEIINGDGNNLMPKASAERCQVAAMLMRFGIFINN